MSYKVNDHFAKKARKEQFVARSVYKLQEIDQKFRVIKKGDYILDLGASPGSWSQYASKAIGEKGRLLGIDLKKVFLDLPNAVFIKGDMLSLDPGPVLEQHGFSRLFDAVISDMAPDTTNSRFTDQMKSLELCEAALATSHRFLRKGGNFVCKIFDSGDAMGFRDELKKHFKLVKLLRPKSVQQSSKEFFMIGLGYKGTESELQVEAKCNDIVGPGI
ncbi:MAG: SAM-dependent methyltransferase [Bacteroidota bacterium]|jgi:23S rRNA (uridine2552-2'-O)-methyltransferase